MLGYRQHQHSHFTRSTTAYAHPHYTRGQSTVAVLQWRYAVAVVTA